MGILAVVQQIVVMLVVAGMGLELRRRDMLTQAGMRSINLVVLNVALPAMILMVTQKDFSPDAKRSFLFILGIALVLLVLSGMLLMKLAKKWLPEKRQAVFAMLVGLPNIGFMGLPLVTALYGAEGALLLAAYITAFNALLFSQYERYFTGGQWSPRRMLTHHGLLACLLAFVLFLLEIRLPDPVPSLLTLLGSTTTPLSMLLTGARMLDFRMKDLRDPSQWAVAGLRLVALPFMVFVVLKALGVSGMPLGVMVLGSSLPSAVSGLMFAERYQKDTVYAATGITLTTVLCLATIPLVLWVTGV